MSVVIGVAVPRSLGRGGRRWRRARARLFTETPDACHICGHVFTNLIKMMGTHPATRPYRIETVWK
jgi:hypothetical protein